MAGVHGTGPVVLRRHGAVGGQAGHGGAVHRRHEEGHRRERRRSVGAGAAESDAALVARRRHESLAGRQAQAGRRIETAATAHHFST